MDELEHLFYDHIHRHSKRDSYIFCRRLIRLLPKYLEHKTLLLDLNAKHFPNCDSRMVRQVIKNIPEELLIKYLSCSWHGIHQEFYFRFKNDEVAFKKIFTVNGVNRYYQFFPGGMTKKLKKWIASQLKNRTEEVWNYDLGKMEVKIRTDEPTEWNDYLTYLKLERLKELKQYHFDSSGSGWSIVCSVYTTTCKSARMLILNEIKRKESLKIKDKNECDDSEYQHSMLYSRLKRSNPLHEMPGITIVGMGIVQIAVGGEHW